MLTPIASIALSIAYKAIDEVAMSSDEALAAQPSLANLPCDILEQLVASLPKEDQ